MADEKKTQVISIRFPPSTFQRLKEFAAKDRRTMNSLVEVACLEYVGRNAKRVRSIEADTVEAAARES